MTVIDTDPQINVNISVDIIAEQNALYQKKDLLQSQSNNTVSLEDMVLKVTNDGDTIEMTPASSFPQVNFSVNIDTEKYDLSSQAYQAKLCSLLQSQAQDEQNENIDQDPETYDFHELSNIILSAYTIIQNGKIIQIRYPGGDEELAELMQQALMECCE